MTKLSTTVERLRAIRKQLADRNELLKDNAEAADLVKASKEFIAKLDALEAKLHNPKAEVSYDILAQKGGAKLYSQLVWLYEQIVDSDGAPAQGIKDVYAEQVGLLEKLELEFKGLLTGDLANLNDKAKKLDVPGVIVPGTGAKKP